jgi:hypothetical protein
MHTDVLHILKNDHTFGITDGGDWHYKQHTKMNVWKNCEAD